MDINVRSIRAIATASLYLCLTACGALPVGMAPTTSGKGACQPDMEIEWKDGLPESNYPLSTAEQQRVKNCDRFYAEAEKQRKEELSQALEEHMSPDEPDDATESTILLSTDSDRNKK